MQFQYTKQSNSSKINVWYQRVLIGSIELLIRERDDIPWEELRADKKKRLDGRDRWNYTWRASTQAELNNLGIFESRELAAEAILNSHIERYRKEV